MYPTFLIWCVSYVVSLVKQFWKTIDCFFPKLSFDISDMGAKYKGYGFSFLNC